MNPNRIISDWRAAYRTAHGRTQAPRIIYRAGWFKIDGISASKRRVEIERMTENLRNAVKETSE